MSQVYIMKVDSTVSSRSTPIDLENNIKWVWHDSIISRRVFSPKLNYE